MQGKEKKNNQVDNAIFPCPISICRHRCGVIFPLLEFSVPRAKFKKPKNESVSEVDHATLDEEREEKSFFPDGETNELCFMRRNIEFFWWVR